MTQTVDGTLQAVIVTSRQESLIGIAGSASEGVIGQDEIEQRPILRLGYEFSPTYSVAVESRSIRVTLMVKF